MKNETKIILFLVVVGIVLGYGYYKQIPISKSKDRVLNYRVGSEELVSSISSENSDFWKSPSGLNVLSKLSNCMSIKVEVEKTTKYEAENICKRSFDECKSSKTFSENKSVESCILKINGRHNIKSN